MADNKTIPGEADGGIGLPGDLTTISRNPGNFKQSNAQRWAGQAADATAVALLAAAIKVQLIFPFTFSVSSPVDPLVAATDIEYWDPPFGITWVSAFATLLVPSTVGAVTFDIKEGGTTILNSLISIPQGALKSAAADILDLVFAANARFTVDCPSAGTSGDALYAKIILNGHFT